VAPDVRLLAARGALAPRALEQLLILALLVEDSDPQIRAAADETVNRIPEAALTAFLASPDVPENLRKFFGERGIRGEGAPPADDAPLVSAPADGTADIPNDEDPQTVAQTLAKMGFSERLKAAIKGSREVRSILIRDANKMIAAAVLSSPKVTEQEVEGYARMTNVSEDILRIIGGTRAWTKNYSVVVGLTKNPKTPLAMSLNLMGRLHDRDLQMLSIDRNVPDPLRVAARRKLVAETSKR
jgi:hypothetical protein